MEFASKFNVNLRLLNYNSSIKSVYTYAVNIAHENCTF